jgi:hypothetical protein
VRFEVLMQVAEDQSLLACSSSMYPITRTYVSERPVAFIFKVNLDDRGNSTM